MRIPSLLALLLKYEGYPPALAVALSLHLAILYFMMDRDLTRSEFVDVERPPYINASVIEQNPQQLRRLETLEQQRQAQAQAERQRQQEAERRAEQEAEAARQREQEQTRERAEAQRRQQQLALQREQEEAQAREEAERRERQRRDQLAREQAAREAEAARQARAQQTQANAAAEASAVSAYTAAIRNAVENSWSPPPSARNGMTALIRIQLVPTGEVVDARVVQSSGDAAFDRSAEQAVLRAGRFPELRDMDISLFEREFRTINLLFKPEDLLR